MFGDMTHGWSLNGPVLEGVDWGDWGDWVAD